MSQTGARMTDDKAGLFGTGQFDPSPLTQELLATAGIPLAPNGQPLFETKFTCVFCNKPACYYSEAGKNEIRISGTCEPCFDKMFPEE